MADQQNPRQNSNTQKPPEEWTTGDERMTGAQRSYLKTLSDEAGVPFDDNLTKAEASKRIDELQKQTGRGRPGDEGASEGGGATGRQSTREGAEGEPMPNRAEQVRHDSEGATGGGGATGRDVSGRVPEAGEPRGAARVNEALPAQPALAGEVAGTTDVAPDNPTVVRESVRNTSDSSGVKVDDEARGDQIKRQLREGSSEISPMD